MAKAKKTKKQFKPWSASRPVKSELEDNLAEQLFGMVSKNKARSAWTWANITGLSPHTIARYRDHKVRRPQALSLQMLAKGLGGKIVFVKN